MLNTCQSGRITNVLLKRNNKRLFKIENQNFFISKNQKHTALFNKK
jgi:hypothetical protein